MFKKMNAFWYVLAGIALLVALLFTCYKAFGALGDAFIITVVILLIIYSLVDVLWFQGLVSKIVGKIRQRKKNKK